MVVIIGENPQVQVETARVYLCSLEAIQHQLLLLVPLGGRALGKALLSQQLCTPLVGERRWGFAAHESLELGGLYEARIVGIEDEPQGLQPHLGELVLLDLEALAHPGGELVKGDQARLVVVKVLENTAPHRRLSA